ncbi:MAG: PEP-CTERM sorting domain-containing protein [Elioraea sp.]|nr:PEP-CTERM sorting domain-containing protein [Elioraea sp.]
MRWGVAALAVATMVALTDPIRLSAFQRSGGQTQTGGPVAGLSTGLPGSTPSAVGAFSLFEDFPFSPTRPGEASGLDLPTLEAIALDPDPDRFGEGIAQSSGRFEALDFVAAGEERGLPEPAGTAVLDTVLSDPLLRDIFGAGPLARFLDEMLRGARGEGSPALVASASPTPEPVRRRSEDRASGPGFWSSPVPWPGLSGGAPGLLPAPSGTPSGGGSSGSGGGGSGGNEPPAVAVPEPATLAALLSGLIGLLAATRRHGG